jgi:hypothetical protein
VSPQNSATWPRRTPQRNVLSSFLVLSLFIFSRCGAFCFNGKAEREERERGIYVNKRGYTNARGFINGSHTHSSRRETERQSDQHGKKGGGRETNETKKKTPRGRKKQKRRRQ